MVRESRPAGVDVALLIDFGNLVRGVEREVDCEALFRFVRDRSTRRGFFARSDLADAR